MASLARAFEYVYIVVEYHIPVDMSSGEQDLSVNGNGSGIHQFLTVQLC